MTVVTGVAGSGKAHLLPQLLNKMKMLYVLIKNGDSIADILDLTVDEAIENLKVIQIFCTHFKHSQILV